MESDHSLSVLILILFLFSEKLVGGAIFKCYQVSLTFSLMYLKTFWHLFCGLLQDGFQILFWPHLCLWASALSQLNDLLFFGEKFILLWHFHFASLTMSGFVLNTQTFRSAALTFPGLSKKGVFQ